VCHNRLAEPAGEAVVATVADLSGELMSVGLFDTLASGLLGEDERGQIGYRHVLVGLAV
jgi:hypothetical protein